MNAPPLLTTSPHTTTHRPSPPRHTLELLLHDRTTLLERITQGDDLIDIARTMMLTLAVSSAVLGAALGGFRGGVQIVYAAIKLPLVMLLTAAISLPAFHALNVVLHRRTDLRYEAVVLISGMALGMLGAAALSPLLVLGMMHGIAYHPMILLTVFVCGIGGAVTLLFMIRGLKRYDTRRIMPVVFFSLVVFSLVGTQLSWTLRPFLVRPRTPEPPIVRSLEGSFAEAVITTGYTTFFGARRPAYVPGRTPGVEESRR